MWLQLRWEESWRVQPSIITFANNIFTCHFSGYCELIAESFTYFVLPNEIQSISTVRNFKFGNPLVIVRSALDSNSSYFGDIINKSDLDPLVYVVCLSWPSTSFASTGGFIEPRVGRSVACFPLAIKQQNVSRWWDRPQRLIIDCKEFNL